MFMHLQPPFGVVVRKPKLKLEASSEDERDVG
jgi:hypothetical protein